MDLGFSQFFPDDACTGMAPDMAVLLVKIAARQAAGPTALLHAQQTNATRSAALLAPVHGAFNPAVAQMLRRNL